MENSPQQSKEHWHLKKEINLAHVLTTLALVASVFFFVGDLDKRILTNAQLIQFMQTQRDDDTKRVEKRLDSIGHKLDKLLQK